MSLFAIMSGNTVNNIIIANSLEEAEVLGNAIEYTEENPAGIGWIWDGTNFINPSEETPNE